MRVVPRRNGSASVNRRPTTRPRQAVLVGCGHTAAVGVSGEGPLLMVGVNGRPFLAHLVELLQHEGFTSLVMLVGHASAAAREYFGSGETRRLRIVYAAGMDSLPPAAQILAARSILDEHFLLVRADTYWPMRFDTMWEEFTAAGALAMTTVYANRDGYATDTVRVSGGFVERFDPASELTHGSDVGYTIAGREALSLMTSQDGGIESALFPTLVARRALAAYPTEHRFYGVHTPERLTMTRMFLSRGPAVILDCDGVLNPRPSPPAHARSVAEFEWLPGALEALRVFRAAGYRIIVVCPVRGQVTVGELEGIHDLMRRGAHAVGGGLDAIYQCPHDWYAGCECRKPRPGLLFQAQRDFSLDLTRTIVLGADETTLRAAAAAGAIGRLVTPEMPLLMHARDILRLRSSA